jgi:molybdenum ABC transporter molybdate-binding protein
MTDLSPTRFRGATHLLLVLVLTGLTLLLGLGAILWYGSSAPGRSNRISSKGAGQELFVYCAAGMRYPIEQVAESFEEQYGVNVQLQYGGSNTLLSQLEISQIGDLYLAGDNSYTELARDKGLASEIFPLARMKPVIAVRQGNPKMIQSADDLARSDVKVALGNPGAAAVGKKARKLLTASGHWTAIEQNVTARGVFKPTVNDVANDIKLGSVDAGIIWDATVAQYGELEAVAIPELDAGQARVEVTVLQSTKSPLLALQFARFLSARDEGLRVFGEMGFDVVEGDIWEEAPELTFYAGLVNRRALQPIVRQFEEREGIRVNTVYNGCGILTAQMRTLQQNQDSGFPDAYMACDVYYLETVHDWFQDDVTVSDTDIVIVLPKGNPKQILALADLVRPGVRVAIGQPDQCTIGVLSRRLLEAAGIYDQLLADNVVTQTATSALLVPNVTTGAADAVLAYETDTLAERDRLEIVRIDSPLAQAVQPYSIARSSDFKHLSRRLYEHIARSRASFESAGFHWRLDDTDEKSNPGP